MAETIGDDFVTRGIHRFKQRALRNLHQGEERVPVGKTPPSRRAESYEQYARHSWVAQMEDAVTKTNDSIRRYHK